MGNYGQMVSYTYIYVYLAVLNFQLESGTKANNWICNNWVFSNNDEIYQCRYSIFLAKPKQSKYEQNYTYVHHSPIAEQQRLNSGRNKHWKIYICE